MRRRRFIATVGAGASLLSAGCTGRSEPEPVDPADCGPGETAIEALVAEPTRYRTAPNRTPITGVVEDPLTEEYMVMNDSSGRAELQPRPQAKIGTDSLSVGECVTATVTTLPNGDAHEDVDIVLTLYALSEPE